MAFIKNYLTYASANEAPALFHVWGAYICLAATVGRKVCFAADDYYLFPHLYVLYVGKAGNGKGEAMGKVRNVLYEIGDVSFSGQVETPEGFIRYICGNPKANPPIESTVRRLITSPLGKVEETTPALIFASEFVNFIAMNPEGWINFLNDIWDTRLVYHYRTKGQGEDLVPGPSISMLGALTTTMAADLQKQRIIGTGLGRRTIFQFGERQWNAAVPRRIMTPERTQAYADCVEELRQISKTVGIMRNSPETDVWWDEWYTENLRLTPTRMFNVQSWYASKPDIVIKLAMLSALSEGTMILTQEHYEGVLFYLAMLEDDLPRIFGGVGRNELAAVAQTIFEFIEGLNEPVSKKKIRGNFFNSCKPPNEFDDCINYLVGEGRVIASELRVGSSLDIVLATPEVMNRFAGVVATVHSPVVGAVTASPLGSDVVARPPSELPGVPVADQFLVPTAPALPNGISIGQLPKPPRKEG